MTTDNDNSATDIVLADIAVAKRVLDRDIAGPCHCDPSVGYICECCFVRQTLNVAANELKRIAALEADNARLREECERLKGIVGDAFRVLDNTEEINPSNYDHDLVCQMNASMCEAYGILKAEAARAAEGGEG